MTAPDGRDTTVLLDDDPTGAQAMADVPVALAWDEGEIGRALEPGDRAIHVLTNTRALDAEEAGAVTLGAARAALADVPSARLVLRGDSTLRGHVWEEFEAAREAAGLPSGATAHLLVPTLPAAGRVTRGGVHLLLRDGEAVRLDETEYARDGALAYRSSRLLEWAEERSGGRMRRQDGVELGLATVRGRDGVAALASAIARAAAGGGCVVPDAETLDDLAVIAAGLRTAERAGSPVLVRCGPAFAATLCGTAATGPPAVDPVARVLVVCGSFVSGSTAQLAALQERHPGVGVELDVVALAGPEADAAVERAARELDAILERGGLAIAATPRRRDPSLVAAASQSAIAGRVADVVRGLHVRPDVVVTKGGITSAVVARRGLGARSARVLGPLLPGASLWSVSGRAQVVVPGNVGDTGLLADLVDRLLAPAPA